MVVGTRSAAEHLTAQFRPGEPGRGARLLPRWGSGLSSEILHPGLASGLMAISTSSRKSSPVGQHPAGRAEFVVLRKHPESTLPNLRVAAGWESQALSLCPLVLHSCPRRDPQRSVVGTGQWRGCPTVRVMPGLGRGHFFGLGFPICWGP